MEEAISTEGADTIRRMAASKERGGQIGRFGVGVKSILAMSAGVPPASVLVELATGGGKTRTSLGLLNGNNRVKARNDLFRPASQPPCTVPNDVTAQPARLSFQTYVPGRMLARAVPVAAAYAAMCDRVEKREATGKHEVRRERMSERRVRDDGSRRAVRLRAGKHCENPDCLLPDGYMPYSTAGGRPLLEVDHIDDHAADGRDHPSVMIALCPNCHENKTHGADRAVLRERLRAVALERHQQLLGSISD
ncbi:HNH endonuclease [Streptomyces sp. RM72]|nr:HNH endonuclease signature motif containing protein [Streptomyces sp. RM72]MBQ0885271.1 HNH endonuclease [Streptomyces sp. RM72]